MSMPPFPALTIPTKADCEVTQWQGKEIRNLGRMILGVFVVALLHPKSEEIYAFKRAIRCVRNLIYFHLMAHYRSHAPKPLRYMDRYLADFYRHKVVFLEFRASKQAGAKARVATKRLKQIHDTQTPHSGSKERKLQEQDRMERKELLVETQQEESLFNFPKMNHLTHFREHVEQYGEIPMFSTEVGEKAHWQQDIEHQIRIILLNKSCCIMHVVMHLLCRYSTFKLSIRMWSLRMTSGMVF